jgi:large subunit ribosomal protein L17
LVKGLATSFIVHGKIKTTLPKAKELVPYIEKLITKAKKGDLSNRRRVISGLSTESAAYRLFDVIAPQLGNRTSGHVRIERGEPRVGDGAEMVTVEFVDTIQDQDKPTPVSTKVKQAEEVKA